MSWKRLRSEPDPDNPDATVHSLDDAEPDEEPPVRSEWPADVRKGFLNEHH